MSVIPDFRNQGVWLRLLLAANGLMLAVALAGNRSLARLPAEIAELAALVEPVLLLSLALLFLLAPWLQRQPGWRAFSFVMLLSMLAMAGMDTLFAWLLGGTAGWRAPLSAGLGTALLLGWFNLRARAQEPALAEARLAALTARIRPHFFFNSLNAVLGVIRSDPRRAEMALEEMSDVFRAVMKENRELIPLDDELALCERYLGLEKLRLGERLHVDLDMDDVPADALVPPLMLQPLVENAVYHGIEPMSEPGTVTVTGHLRGGEVVLEVANPVSQGGAPHQGNQMAMANIRERLMLFYDLEASLAVEADATQYRVRIRLPYRRKSA